MKLALGAAGTCCVLIVGCGGSETDVPARTQSKPAPVVDKRPRVQGTWRVVYRPRDYTGKTIRSTWRITPSCDVGPCTFKARSSRKFTFDAFKFDDAIGDYTFNQREILPCGDGSGKTLARRGYSVSRQLNMTVVKSQKAGAGRVATRMTGTNAVSYRTTKQASLANCSDEPKETDRVTAVRVKP